MVVLLVLRFFESLMGSLQRAIYNCCTGCRIVYLWKMTAVGRKDEEEAEMLKLLVIDASH